MKYLTCLLFVSLTWTGFAENVLIDFKQPGPPFPKATDRGKEKPSVQILKDKEPLRIGEQIGTVQIITKASKGNHAWDLDIAKISFK